MDFEEFKDRVVKEIRKYLPERYEKAHVKLDTVRKLGSGYTGLSVYFDGQEAAATASLNMYFDAYRAGASFEEIMRSIAEIAMMEPPEVNNDLLDYSKVKDDLFIRLSNLESNRRLMDNIPCRTVEDMIVTYHVCTKKGKGDMWCAMVTEDMRKAWNITEEQLFNDALESGEKNFPALLKPLGQLIGNPEAAPGMLVLTTMTKVNGACALLYPGLLQEAAEMLGGDVYILPASVHEMIIVPAADDVDPESLARTVRYVNISQIPPKDRLSNSIYHYDLKSGRFETALS